MSRPEGHWRLAMEFYAGRPELLSAFARRRPVETKRAIFSPQALVLLMRLLLEHAYDEPLRDATVAEAPLMQDAVLGAHSAIEGGFDPSGPPSREEVLAFELQSATFFHRPDWLEEIARHQELLRLATTDERLAGSANLVPVDAWLAAAGLTIDDQCTLGLGLGPSAIPTNIPGRRRTARWRARGFTGHCAPPSPAAGRPCCPSG